MTDWNKELDLLSEWLNYRIDWYAMYVEYFSPKAHFMLWLRTGISLFHHTGFPCLTFEEWKQLNNN